MINVLCIVLMAAAVPLSQAVISEGQQATILTLHNTFRGDVTPSASNMVPLQWDSQLAEKAQTWASQCAFNHDEAADRVIGDWTSVGQNIAYGYGYPFNTYFALWNDEKSDYDFGAHTCAGTCGHYTQVVWAASTHIGCGHAKCENTIKTKTYQFDYIVCNYGPAGNYEGVRPYTSGTSCTACPSGYGGGYDGNLCTLG